LNWRKQSADARNGERTQHDDVPAAADRFVQRVFEEVSKPVKKFNRVRKQIFKSICAFFITIGLLGSINAFFTIFYMVLPDIKGFIVHKDDRFVLEAAYKLAKNAVIYATIAGAVLAFSMMGLWHFLKGWYHERKIKNKKPPSI
jgi:hypothetical protein